MKKTEEFIKRTVLVVDDEAINREILGNMISSEYEVLYAGDGREALEVMREKKDELSLVLLDILMPELDGLELLEIAGEDEEISDIPVIVMTSERAMEVSSLELGAVDFIKKPCNSPKVILARMKRVIELYEDRSTIEKVERDDLTGLYTKEFFINYVEKIDHYNLSHGYDAVAINIDHFHLLNELYGRDFGDEVLIGISSVMEQVLALGEGIGCRAEADMFYMYTAHREDYGELADRLNTELKRIVNNKSIKLRMGVYQDVDIKLQVASQIDRAVVACNTIRDDFSRLVAYYDSKLHDEDLRYQRLLSDFDEAIARQHFKVYYQPKYDVSGDIPRLRSSEVLIRWEHPEFGMISPGVFIPLFENNGLITRLDHYVWEQAAKQVREWKDRYGADIPVSVNVSRIDIYDTKLTEVIDRILSSNGLTGEDVYLEITESAYAEDSDQLISVVEQLRAKGLRIEMDDFGSGYSSLSMLSRLPVDYLKLDMKFVDSLSEGRKEIRLIQLIKDIADYLEVPVVAEGVSSEEQYRLLKDMGIVIIQGYYFSKPLAAEQFAELLEKEKTEV